MLSCQEFGPSGGRPAVFLHPANVGGRIWAGPVAALDNVRGICPDLPGFGMSAGIPMKGFDAAADLVAETLVARGTGPVPVIGYSYGSYVALCLALRHPDLVDRLFFISGQVTRIKGAWWMAAVTALFAPFLAGRTARERAFERLGVARGSAWFPDDVGDTSARALFRVSAHALRFEAKPVAREISVPVLAVAGAREHPAIRDTIAFFQSEVPLAKARLAPGGHGWPATAPELFTETMRAFLEGTDLPDGLLRP